jgi:hypothetical protein
MDNEEDELEGVYNAIATSLDNFEKEKEKLAKIIVYLDKIIRKSKLEEKEKEKAGDKLSNFSTDVYKDYENVAKGLLGFANLYRPKIKDSKEDKEAVKKATEKEREKKQKRERSYTKGDD